MLILRMVLLSMGIVLLSACTPVKTIGTNQYQLTAYSLRPVTNKPRHITLLVTPPDAAAGFQTEQMLYVKKPYQVEAFAKNTWTSPPGDMLYPLIMESMQKTGYFMAVSSSVYTEGTDYRLDTQLLSLEQNFLRKPSVLEFSAKVVLTHVADNRVLGSKMISLSIPCPADTPYGGVIAANRAVKQFTGIVTDFVLSRVAQG